MEQCASDHCGPILCYSDSPHSTILCSNVIDVAGLVNVYMATESVDELSCLWPDP